MARATSWTGFVLSSEFQGLGDRQDWFKSGAMSHAVLISAPLCAAKDPV